MRRNGREAFLPPFEKKKENYGGKKKKDKCIHHKKITKKSPPSFIVALWLRAYVRCPMGPTVETSIS